MNSIFFIVKTTYAHWKLNLESIGRSYPLSGTLDIKLAYRYPIWGNLDDPSFLFGYVKPEVTFASAGSYNSGSGEIDIFPISFLSLGIGQKAFQNNKDYTNYECQDYQCQGYYTNQFWKAQLMFGFKNLFGVYQHKNNKFKSYQNNAPAIDPTSGLIFDSDNDAIQLDQLILGFHHNQKWVVFLLGMQWQQIETKQNSHFFSLNLRYASKNWSLFAGPSFYQTKRIKNSAGVGGGFSWTLF